MTLAYRRKPVVFFTLAGVKTVDLVECDKIRGAWWPYARRFVINDEAKPARFANASSKLLENFANWPCTPEDVLRFTKNYGPLTSTAVGNGTFSFSVNDWRSSQKEFQQGWKQLMQKSRSVVSKLLGPPLSPEDGEEFFFSGTGLEYRTATLYRLLCVELFSIPKEKLRKCAKPDCENPYFIRSHALQTYCSPACANWAQKQQKRDWWNTEGQKARRKIRTKAKKLRSGETRGN